jgi:hypothetical protein
LRYGLVKRVIGRKKISRRIQCAAPGAPIQPVSL